MDMYKKTKCSDTVDLKKKKSNFKLTYLIYIVILSLVLVAAVGLVLIRFFESSEPIEILKYHVVGDTVENRYGSITYISSDEINKICVFKIVKNNNAPIYIRFSGMDADMTVGESGEPEVIPETYWEIDFITPYANYKTKIADEVKTDVLKIFVNGEEAEGLPSAAGEYEIAIDYSSTSDHVYYLKEKFYISRFGNFALIDIFDDQ